MIAPESFALNDIDGHAAVVTEDVPKAYEGRVREAAHSRPEQAIVIDGMQL